MTKKTKPTPEAPPTPLALTLLRNIDQRLNNLQVALEDLGRQVRSMQAPPVEAKPPPPAAPPPDKMEELRRAVLAYVAKHGREALVTLLRAYGATKASEVPAEKLESFMRTLTNA